ncbi:MAG: flagellar hook-basal body complex protein, partial [Gammaproteobacteria bacterium]|nr:flagellar hook-basal body complex protein [Gammaproteobacteria bacterium]
SGSTQFGNNASTTSLNQNGYTSGALVGISIDSDGTVVRSYSNEQTRPAGQIALASFRNPEGLSPAGDNTWAATDASGQELVGAPGTGLLGGIQSGAIETSNVDMAKELVSMIVTQRAYQANSQTIKTQDEVLQTAINLR